MKKDTTAVLTVIMIIFASIMFCGWMRWRIHHMEPTVIREVIVEPHRPHPHIDIEINRHR